MVDFSLRFPMLTGVKGKFESEEPARLRQTKLTQGTVTKEYY